MGHPDHNHEQENLKQPRQNPTVENQKSVQINGAAYETLIPSLITDFIGIQLGSERIKCIPAACAKTFFPEAVSLLRGPEWRVQTDAVMLVIKELSLAGPDNRKRHFLLQRKQ